MNLGNRYLPPYASCPFIFLKEVLAGRKKLLKKEEIIPRECPKYAEFTVKMFYEVFKEDERLLKFIPDLKWSKKLPDREFVVNVISSLKP